MELDLATRATKTAQRSHVCWPMTVEHTCRVKQRPFDVHCAAHTPLDKPRIVAWLFLSKKIERMNNITHVLIDDDYHQHTFTVYNACW